MGVPFEYHSFCSLLAVEEFVDRNPDLMEAKITITGVHVRDVFDLVELLRGRGWDIQNLESIHREGRKFALFVEDFEFLVDQAIKCIDDDGSVTAHLGESLKKEASKFLELVKGNKSFNFFIGFAQFMVHVSDNAIEAAAFPDGEEESDTDGEEESDMDGEDAVDGDEGVVADGEEEDDEGADEAIEVQAPRLVQLREKLVQVEAALKRLPAVRLVFPLEQNPVHYGELADFAHSFPLEPEPEPEPEPVVPPALPIPAQPNANGAHAAPED